MKLISVNSIKIGEQLSFDLRAGNGAMLLRSRTVLTQNMVNRLKALGFYAVYIEDDQYDDVEVRQAIPDDMKTEILSALEEMRPKIIRGRNPNVDAIKEMGRNILDEVRVSVLEPINMVSTFAVDNPSLLHAINTAIVTAAISVKSGIKPQFVENYVVAALLHDICLDDLERDMEDNYEHTTKVYAMMKETSAFDATCFMSASLHHERFDGTGGPRRLVGKQISEGARIIACADLFDKVSFGYAGMPKLSPEHAVEYIVAQAGLTLDPDITRVFSESISIYPTGATVILKDGRRAVVSKQNDKMPARPVLRIVTPDASLRAEIDMLRDMSVFIEKIDL